MGGLNDGQIFYLLRQHTMVGRSPGADLALTDKQVSNEHAVVYYCEDRWVLKDLGSRNGTYLNSRRIEPQVREPLSKDDTISFGTRLSFVLSDDSAPAATARRLGDGEVVVADLGLLVLPSQTGSATVYCERSSWWLERADVRSPVQNRQVIALDGVDWELALPDERAIDDQTETVASTYELTQAGLCFAVSADEEHVQISVELPSGTRTLPTRTFGYLLLLLARARLRDAQQAALSEGEHGWLYAEELMRELDVDASHLNVDIFRARKLFDLPELRNPSEIIERRASTRQVRLGSGRIKISRL